MGYEKLSRCCVKKIKSCEEYDEIPGDVIYVIYQTFNNFLKEHDYPDKFRFNELSRINKYLNRACTYSRKAMSQMEDWEYNYFLICYSIFYVSIVCQQFCSLQVLVLYENILF